MRTALALMGAFTLCIEFLYSSKKIASMQQFNTVHRSFEQVTSRTLQIYNRDVVAIMNSISVPIRHSPGSYTIRLMGRARERDAVSFMNRFS
jgi:hypothetical protein